MLSVDVTDDSGEHSIAGFEQGVIKTRLDLQGKPLEVGETVSK